MACSSWHLVIGTTCKLPAMLLLAHAAPLLKKERNASVTALVSNADDPLLPHWAGTWPAFAADNHPIHTRKIKLTQVF